MLLSRFYKFHEVLKNPGKILEENTTSQIIFTVFLILLLGEVLKNTELGAVDFATLQKATVQKASKYTKWTVENRYTIGKYASEHGNAAAVCHLKKRLSRH